MASIREAVVEAYLVQRVKELGGEAFKWNGPRGAPDRIVFLNGGVYFVELKRPRGGRFQPGQKRFHQKLAARGHPVHVLHSKAAVDLWLWAPTEYHYVVR